MRRFRRLLAWLSPYRAAFAASTAAAVVAGVFDGFTFSLLIPLLRLLFGAETAIAAAPTPLERLLETVAGPAFADDPRRALVAVAVLILVAVLLKNAAYWISTYLGVRIREGVARDLRVALYEHLQTLALPFFGRTRGGELMSRMLSDADQTRVAVSHALAQVLRSAAVVLVYVALLFAISWRLTLVALVITPALAIGLRPILRRVRERARHATASRGDMAAVMAETVAGARLVKAHAAEPYERRRFLAAADRHVSDVLRAERVAILASPLSETLGATLLAGLLLAGTWAGVTGAMLRPELFVAFIAVTLRLMSPLKVLAHFPTIAEEALAAADRIFAVLDVPPDDVDERGAPGFPGLRDTIEFRDVWVAYDGEAWALSGVNLTVRRGEVVAIVGPSGAGKSTLVDLLPRFVDPTRGEILIDGVPLATYGRRSVRRGLGIVSQETVIVHDTVRTNIAYGDEAGASPEAVEAAARAANAHDFIMRLPQGYDTVLGERGARLSGGERQRIALARALLRDPPILILDEATSALDPASDRLVQEAAGRLLEDRTVFVIAHRLSTVARADRIVVLDRGEIVEVGSHDELVAAGGVYRRQLESYRL